jgi:hypothetical protein
VNGDQLLHCPNLGLGYDQVRFDMKCSEMFCFYCATYHFVFSLNILRLNENVTNVIRVSVFCLNSSDQGLQTFSLFLKIKD